MLVKSMDGKFIRDGVLQVLLLPARFLDERRDVLPILTSESTASVLPGMLDPSSFPFDSLTHHFGERFITRRHWDAWSEEGDGYETGVIRGFSTCFVKVLV